MEVDRIMTPEVEAIGPETPLKDVVEHLGRPDIRHVYVVDKDGKLLGIISNLDLLRKFLPEYLDANLSQLIIADDELLRSRYKDVAHLTAADLMTEKIDALTLDRGVLQAEALMVQHRYNALPVVDASGRLKGEVSRKSVLSYISRAALQG